MASKIVQFKQSDMFQSLHEKKPVQKMTEEEFAEFIKDCFAHILRGFDEMKRSFSAVFATCNELEKFNELLTLHQYDLQDKIIEHEEEIQKLKNP